MCIGSITSGTPELTLVSTVVEQYDYVYNGSSLVQMVVTTTTTADEETTTSTDTLFFAYDAFGSPLSVTYNNTDYYYTANIQGDIVGVVDSTGTQVVSYSYDAWGNALSVTGTMAETLGYVNPLRYRGYVYDIDTGLFYLQSRYYSPETGRFLNADSYATTGQGFIGNNMFAYCGNNAVNSSDPSGHYFRSANSLISYTCADGYGGDPLAADVVVISNSAEGWMESSAIVGNDLAAALGLHSSYVVAATNGNFYYTWENISSEYVIIHAHGSPNSISGDGNAAFRVTVADGANMKRNSNISFVFLMVCSTGGNNGANINMGQLISQKISPDGYVICCTDVISGTPDYVRPYYSTGYWVVYQNGQQVAIIPYSVLTMEDIAEYYKNHLK